MEKEGQREMGGRGVNYGGDIYSCGELLGATLEIIAYSVRVSHSARNGENYWTGRMRSKNKRGLTISNILGDVSGL